MNHPSPARPAQRLDRSGLLCWLAGLLPAAIALAWLARQIEVHFAPVLLFPVLMGVALGAASSALARLFQFEHRVVAVIGTAVAGVLMAGALHYFAFLGYQEAYRQQMDKNPQALLLKHAVGDLGPASFTEFLQLQASRGRPVRNWVLSGWMAWTMWAVEAIAAILAAAVTAWWTCPQMHGQSQEKNPESPELSSS